MDECELSQAVKWLCTTLPHSLYATESLRVLERRIADVEQISLYQLMERAGLALEHFINTQWPIRRRVRIYVGGGNNGGDGLVLARRLQHSGYAVEVVAVSANRRPDEAMQALHAWLAQGGELKSAASPDFQPDLIVDALLGIGLKRPPEGEVAELIREINQLAEQGTPVLAIDLPSGLNSDSGTALGVCVKATATLTLIAPKGGLLTGVGPDMVGKLYCSTLSNLPPLSDSGASALRCDYPSLSAQLPKRRGATHKGEQGRLLVVGGAQGMQGALVLAAQAALRSGAGIVQTLCHPENPPAALWQAELMGDQGDPSWATTLLIGCGLGQSTWSAAQFAVQLARPLPKVVDADALNLLAKEPRFDSNWILTPHPGEAARLLGCTTVQIEQDRFAAVRSLQQKYGGVVVLKGAGTLIYDGELLFLANVGTPLMASGGMGDLLSGIIAGLLAQGVPSSLAARLGVVLHGEAGSRIAQRGAGRLVASDLLHELATLF